VNNKEQTNISFASSMSIFALSLASLPIAINSAVIHIILAQEETEDFVEMEMDNGTTISVANSTLTVMENGTIQSKNASDPNKSN
jgi:hypothetical protein